MPLLGCEHTPLPEEQVRGDGHSPGAKLSCVSSKAIRLTAERGPPSSPWHAFPHPAQALHTFLCHDVGREG